MASTTGSRTNRLVLACALVAMCASFSTSALGQVEYEYTGNAFNIFLPNPDASSYTTADNVSVRLTLLAPLPGDLANQDITGFPGFSLTMEDGHQQMLFSSPATGSEAVVSTDAGGNITAWKIFIVCCDYPNNQIFTQNDAQAVGDLAFLSQRSAAYTDTPVDGAVRFLSPGTWVQRDVTPSDVTQDMIDDITALIDEDLNYGEASSLIELLTIARQSMDRNRTQAACVQLDAFIRQVIQMTPLLGPELSTEFIETALGQQVVLGCSRP